jgi:uncharacterized protein YqeY
MQQEIEKDLKAAMLAGDKLKTETLRGLKNALQYEAVSAGSKDRLLTDEQIQKVFAKEAKKRQEAADLYKQGGNHEKAETELTEKQIIDAYLPEQASEADITKVVEEEVGKVENPTNADMGRIIGTVRTKLGASADGATIAKLVKDRLGQ